MPRRSPMDRVQTAVLNNEPGDRRTVRREHDRVVQAALDEMTEGVIVADPAGRFLLFNRAAERILGLGLLHVDPASWSATYGCFRSEALEPFPAEELPLARAVRGEATNEVEAFIRNPHVPRGVWISINGAPLTGGDGSHVGGIIAFRDITTRRHAEDRLRTSLRNLEELKEALDQAAIVAVTDAGGTITYVNERFCCISGYAREELVGCNHRLVKSGHHPDQFFDTMWQTITRGEAWRGVVENRARSGDRYWLDTTIVPLLDAHRVPERYLAISTDVTERVRHEEMVHRLSSVVEQTADSVFITDRNGVIEYVNPAFEATTGYSWAV